MNILEFVKKFTTFKPSPYHEAFFKVIEESIEKEESGEAQFVDRNHYRWYKNLKFNEFTYSHMLKMAEGQTFAIASPAGIHIFKKIEFRDTQDDKE